MSGPQSRFLRPGDLRLHVRTQGNPEAPPVLLVHGLWDHNRSWDWIAAHLAPNFHVIAPDLRGHGESDWAGPDGYTLGAYVLDLADLVDALDLQRFGLVGHSLGGVLGLRLAAAFPERVCAFAGIECVTLPIHRDELVSPKPYPLRLRHWIEKSRERRLREGASFIDRDAALQRMMHNHPSLDEETARHLVDHGVRDLPQGGCTWKFDPRVRGRPPEDQRAHDLRDVLRGVTCPSLLVYGDSAERPAPGPDLLHLFADIRLQIMPGGSHSLHHQMRAAFLDILNPFLDQHLRKVCHA